MNTSQYICYIIYISHEIQDINKIKRGCKKEILNRKMKKRGITQD